MSVDQEYVRFHRAGAKRRIEPFILPRKGDDAEDISRLRPAYIEVKEPVPAEEYEGPVVPDFE